MFAAKITLHVSSTENLSVKGTQKQAHTPQYKGKTTCDLTRCVIGPCVYVCRHALVCVETD